MDEQENGITNGYAWYQVFGGRQDYVTYFIRGREVTIELSDDKIPNENRLADYWNYINRSLLQYISRVFTGIFGTVTDLATSLPVAAVISIRNHDMDQSEVIADSSDGHFYRFTLPGTFTLDFQAPGYQPETITLNVTPDDLAYASVKLSKGQQLSIFPNPFSELLRIYVPVSNIFLALDFTDMSGRNIKRIVQSVVTSGWQEVEVTGLAPGVYIVHATAGQMHLQETLLKIR